MNCEICGKKTVFGKQVAHNRMYISGKTSRKVKPNLQRTTIRENGVKRQVTACTRCMRTLRKHHMPRQ